MRHAFVFCTVINSLIKYSYFNIWKLFSRLSLSDLLSNLRYYMHNIIIIVLFLQIDSTVSSHYFININILPFNIYVPVLYNV